MISLFILSIQVGNVTVVKFIPLDIFNIISSYPLFDYYFKKYFFIHLPFLVLIEIPIRTNDYKFDRYSDLFLIEHLDKI